MIDDFKPASQPPKSPKPDPQHPPATIKPIVITPDGEFQTPETVAAAEDSSPPPAAPNASHIPTAEPAAAPPSKPKSGWRQKLSLSWPPGKKEYIVLAALIVLVGGGFAAWHFTHKPKPVAAPPKLNVIKKSAPPAPTTVPSTLTGLPVDPGVNKLPVTGVMVENSDFARPQSGLGQAGVVFEAIAEGGITRFLALFQDSAPTDVGPIRSARPYYVQWALGFDAGYAHVGGSPEALADIKTWGARDLDQFYNSGSYHRISARQAPHNVYTGIVTLNQLETKKGYTTSTYTGFLRKPDSPAKVPTASAIKLTLSGPDYDSSYTYNKAANNYLRDEAGTPHIDANTNTQISPKVVVAMVMHYSLEADGYHSDYNVIGSGPVYVFQDGAVTTGQWSKTSNAGQISFTTASGAPLKLNAGQTWITAVAGTNDVSYTP
jgi:hypothetical protein